MSDFKIDKNVPMSTPSASARTKYPFAQMEVGDSFTVPLDHRITISAAAGQFAKRQNPQWKFTTKKVSETEIRIWRTK